MSLVDAFAKEDRTEVKFSQFFALVKQAAQYETLMNAVNCDVPHRFIRETMTGKKEEVPEIPEKKEAVLGAVKVDFDAEEFRKILQEATAEIEAKFGPAEGEAEQEQAATEQEREATEQEQENTEKEPPEVTAESILEAAEEATCRRQKGE
jgi:lipoate-protein ligase A